MIDLSPYKLHLFDLDDTLINTRYTYTIAQRQALEQVFSDISPELIEQILLDLFWLCRQFGSGNPEAYFKALITLHSSILSPDSESLQKLLLNYRDSYQSQLTCFAGVKAYIRQIKSQGKITAIVSNGIRETQLDKLKQVGLVNLFTENLVFISGDYPPVMKKPSPCMIQEACAATAISNEDTVFYGNTSSDILAGNLAGVSTVHYNGSTPLEEGIPKSARPTASIDHWESLINHHALPGATKHEN